MPNLFDYIATERATFDTKPFGPLDAAVLTQACMIDAPGIVPAPQQALPGPLARAAALVSPVYEGTRFADILAAAEGEHARSMFTGLVPEDIKRLLYALAASPRFCSLRLRDLSCVVDDSVPVQFGALTFTWRDRFAFVALRGTDAPFPGWCENLTMCYQDEVAAQRLARSYLDAVARHLPRRLYVGGHSKGGNLALYAALTCTDAVRSRIVRVWSLDGPGFKHGRFCAADWDRLAGRAVRIVPRDSIVGMLLECPLAPTTVQSSAAGLDQHSVFTWEVADNDFMRVPQPSEVSLGFSDVLNGWLNAMDDERKRRVVNALFAAVAASGASDAADLFEGGWDAVGHVMEAAARIDGASRDILNDAVGDLLARVARRAGANASETIRAWLRPKPEPAMPREPE